MGNTSQSIETEIEFVQAWRAVDPSPTVTIDRERLVQLYGQ